MLAYRYMKTPHQYKVIITDTEDGFVAEVPALPGCHTQAKTKKKLMENVKEAIELYLETDKRDPKHRREITEWLGYNVYSVGMEIVSV